MAEGYVYILLNPALRGQVKIGRTMNSPEERAAELSSTGLPHEFVVAYAERVADCETVERLVHQRFAGARVNPNREFFRVSAHEAVQAVLELAAPYRIAEGQVLVPPNRPVFTLALTPTCPKCGTLYSITLRRYEYHVRCPECFGLDAVEVDWK